MQRGYLLLGMIYQCVGLAMSGTESSNLKLVGPQLCKRLCNEKIGCNSYIFKVSALSCCLLSGKPDKSDRDFWIFLVKDKERLYAENQNCLLNARIFRSKRKSVLCRRLFSVERHQEAMTRLLILPTNLGFKGKQLHLHNNSLQDYTFIKGQVYSAVYVSDVKKLLVCTMWPMELFFIYLDKSEKTVIMKDKIFFGMTTDENKKLVFMTMLSPGTSVGVTSMTTQGENFKSVVIFKPCKKVSGIATDCKRGIFYAECTYKYLVKYTYNGTLLEKYTTNIMPWGLCIDSRRGLLYYMTGEQSIIYKTSLTGKMSESIIVTHLGFKGESLHFIGSHFYLVPYVHSGHVIVVNQNGKQSMLNYLIEGCTVRLCAIP